MPSRTRVPKTTKASRRAAVAAAGRFLKGAVAEGDAADPLLGLWRAWRAAFAATRRHCRTAQRLERELAERIGFPRVAIATADPDRPTVWVTEPEQIDWVLGQEAATAAQRQRLTRELADVRARWDAEAAACGHTEAQEREAAAGRRAEELLRTAAATPARSLAGVIAKLAVAAEWSLSEPEADGHPWTFLATALADLIAIAAVDTDRGTDQSA
ncbi:MAG TPA: hypothetical protein VGE72_07625 [Azospirillum sp.]